SVSVISRVKVSTVTAASSYTVNPCKGTRGVTWAGTTPSRTPSSLDTSNRCASCPGMHSPDPGHVRSPTSATTKQNRRPSPSSDGPAQPPAPAAAAYSAVHNNRGTTTASNARTHRAPRASSTAAPARNDTPASLRRGAVSAYASRTNPTSRSTSAPSNSNARNNRATTSGPETRRPVSTRDTVG